MSSPGNAPQAPTLSRGLEIEYKAFTRSFFRDDRAAVLYLVATCYYLNAGMTIFFEENEGKFQLMQQPPTGFFPHLATYYVASWPPAGASGEVDHLPDEVTVVDAYGEYQIPVKPWE
jgi:hypothetical protein